MYCRHLQYTRAIATCADHQHQRRAPSFPTTPTVTAGGRSDARPLPPAATPPPGQPPLVVRRGPTHACILSMFIARRRPPSAALLPPRGLGKPAAAGRRKKKNRRKKKKRFGWPPRRNSPPSASSWPQRAALPGGDLAAPLPTNAAPGRQPRGYAPPPHRPHTAIMIRMILVTPWRQLVWPKSDAVGTWCACKRTGPHLHTHCTRRRQVGAAPSCRPRARYRDIRLSAAPAARARAFRTVYSDAGLGGERLVRAPRILAPP